MAAENSFVQPTTPKFDGYYDHWAILMEHFLWSKEYWNLAKNDIPTVPAGAVLVESHR